SASQAIIMVANTGRGLRRHVQGNLPSAQRRQKQAASPTRPGISGSACRGPCPGSKLQNAMFGHTQAWKPARTALSLSLLCAQKPGSRVATAKRETGKAAASNHRGCKSDLSHG